MAEINHPEFGSAKLGRKALKEDCQSYVVSFAARRRGLDCKAKPYDFAIEKMCSLGERIQDAWLDGCQDWKYF